MSNRNGMKMQTTTKRRRAAPKRKTVNPKVVQRSRTSRPSRLSETKRQRPDSLSSASSAPVAVSSSRTARTAYSASTRSDGRSCLRIRSTVPICEIGNDSFNNGLFIQSTGGATYNTVADLSPYEIAHAAYVTTSATGQRGNLAWISPHIPLMALAFDRYTVDSLVFHYEPQSTAVQADRLVFAWTDDPDHPFLGSLGAADSTAPSQLQLLITQDSVAFMPWKRWDLRVPVSKDARFMYDSTDIDQGNTQTRFYSFGSMSCVGTAAPSDPLVYGVLYVDVVFDFFDPVPIVSTIGDLVTALHSVRREHKRGHAHRRPLAGPATLTRTSDHRHTDDLDEKKEKVEEDDEWTRSTPPPRFVPAPSSIPGSNGYVASTPPPTPKVPSRK
jgi:hypothetical protein